MRIRIFGYNEWHSFGGSLNLIAMLANGLARSHDVEVVLSKPIDVAALSRFSGVDLSAVRFASLEPKALTFARRGRSRFAIHPAEWSVGKGWDVLISTVHTMPPVNRARVGLVYVHFPYYRLGQGGRPSRWLGDRLADAALRVVDGIRLRSYDLVLANSTFTQKWIADRWKRSSTVLYPPHVALGAALETSESERRQRIVSLGRFQSEGEKRQTEMRDVFASLLGEATDLEFVAVGVYGSAAEAAYGEALNSGGVPVEVRVDIVHDELVDLLTTSSILWHAKGFGERSETPEKFEHFGMAIVEAMSFGCVPVVYRGGGSAEIVRHEIDGFLWDDLDQLRDFTLALIRDDALRTRMSLSARQRAQVFPDGPQFASEVEKHLVGLSVPAGKRPRRHRLLGRP
jgi:glycosyltransferase involved in cell wall biosynthesis